MVFSWPKPNLDRINKRIEFIKEARMGTKSKICITADAGKGSSAVIDKKDEWMNGMVDAASEIGGDGSITLKPNGMNRTILVGKDSYKYVNISDATISLLCPQQPELFPGDTKNMIIKQLENGIESHATTDK